MQNILVNVNGTFFTPKSLESGPQPSVSVFDRSFLYGDSLYEVARTYKGKLLMLDEHLERLAKSAELCKMKLSQSLKFYAEEMNRSVREFQKLFGPKEAYCRIIVTRGVGEIGFALNCVKTPTQVVLILKPIDEITPEKWEKGTALKISNRIRNSPRSLDPAMKSGNYLNSLLAFLEAHEEGFDDAILCNDEGFLTEGTTFNFGYIRRGVVATSELSVGILDGLTRRKVLELAQANGIQTYVGPFTREHLLAADEVFVTSTLKEVFPVLKLGSQTIGNGKPGPITRKLQSYFKDWVESL